MMKLEQIQEAIRQGEAVCGIELGSTRIKAVLIGPDHTPIATGAFDWENQRAGGVWTYPLELAWQGIQAAPGQGGQPALRVPHLAQHHHRGGSGPADRAVRL